MAMEQFFPSADQWVFDYMVYRFLTNYTTDLSRSKFRSRRHCSVIKELIHEGLEHMAPNQRKAHLLLLVFILQEIEKINLGLKEVDSDEEEDESEVEPSPVLSMEDYDTIRRHLTDMQKSLTVFLEEAEMQSIRNLARKCLVDSHVMKFQCSFRLGSDEKETLEAFEKLVNESDNSEEKELYQFCHKFNPVGGKFRPISGFIFNVKELISTINSCFEIPHLIQFAMNSLEDGNVLMEYLLEDQRPSRKADLMEFSVDLTDSRKEELDQLFVSIEADSLPAMAEVEQRIQPSPLPNSSRIQEEQGIQNPNLPSTSRIQEDQRIQPSNLPSTSNIEGDINGTPTKDQYGFTYMSALGKRLKEFSAEDCLYKLRRMEVKLKKAKKQLGPPSHQNARLGPWLPDEETQFIEETLKAGVGNWATIKETLGTARSSQQLKDKWRNISQNQIKEVAKRLHISYP